MTRNLHRTITPHLLLALLLFSSSAFISLSGQEQKLALTHDVFSGVRPEVKQPGFHVPSAFRPWRIP